MTARQADAQALPMLERMAGALHDGQIMATGDYDDLSPARKTQLRMMARAALNELEHPTEEMMAAAERTPTMQFVALALLQAKNHGMGELEPGTRIVRDVWQAMRAAILEEQG